MQQQVRLQSNINVLPNARRQKKTKSSLGRRHTGARIGLAKINQLGVTIHQAILIEEFIIDHRHLKCINDDIPAEFIDIIWYVEFAILGIAPVPMKKIPKNNPTNKRGRRRGVGWIRYFSLKGHVISNKDDIAFIWVLVTQVWCYLFVVYFNRQF